MKTTTQKVLVAVDGSSQAMDAIRYVAGFFPPMHTDVVLFHAAAEVPEAFLDLAGVPDAEAETLPVEAWARRSQEDVGEFMEKGHAAARPRSFRDQDRGHLRAVRRPSGSRVSRWPRADRTARLYQLGGLAAHSRG